MSMQFSLLHRIACVGCSVSYYESKAKPWKQVIVKASFWEQQNQTGEWAKAEVECHFQILKEEYDYYFTYLEN